jgi:imidazolonepropionase-like amidohydrolase
LVIVRLVKNLRVPCSTGGPRRKALLVATQLGLAIACAEPERAARPPQDLVLTHVTIVDTRTGAETPGSVVVIEEGKITRVSSGGAAPPGAAATIDGGGRWLVPGYLDMHAHALQSDPERSLTLMLARGITGYRQMAGTPGLLERRRAGELASRADTPELLAMPGLPLVEPLAASPEAALAEVREQHALGADFIKVASLDPEAFAAALGEARRLGLPLVGHLPDTVDAIAAAAGGMRSVEHLGPHVSLLLGCSSEEAELRRAIAEAPRRGPPGLPAPLVKLALPLLGRFLERLVANPVLLGDAAQRELLRRVIGSYSEEKCLAFASELARAGVWQVPTLIRKQTTHLAGNPAYLDDANLRFVPPETRELWASLAVRFREEISPEHRALLARAFALQVELVRLFDRAGVRMLAGSDMGGAQWIVPGIGLHQEFDLLERAGLSPLRVLQMTTLFGAEFLGRAASLGAVEVGKSGDLVLLDADPTESVQSLHAIAAVVRAGRYYSRADLDELEATAARHGR